MSLEDFQSSLKQSAEQFKKWFNIDPNSDDWTDKGLALCSDFYSKLRTCVPGVYKYPFLNLRMGRRPDNTVAPMFLLGTSSIEGEKNGKCIVKTTRMLVDGSSLTSHCEYTSSDRAFFTTEVGDNMGCRAAIFSTPEEMLFLKDGDKPHEKTQVEEISDRACVLSPKL